MEIYITSFFGFVRFEVEKSRNARILHLALSLIFLLGEVLFLLVFLFVPEPDVLLHTCILSYLNAYILAYISLKRPATAIETMPVKN